MNAISIIQPAQEWIAQFDASHLTRSFWLPADWTEGQARYAIVEQYAPARSAAWTPERPEASLHMTLVKAVGVGKVDDGVVVRRAAA